ncbi:MAG TPA: xanthine dehydrogenase family protein molybdopterin-binding subunit [Verrucomicrobiae bacterium]|nr:xanthine dehydrogenase family protein molybdopterin-binding subunit [Verrucomicrobiae bacterium]
MPSWPENRTHIGSSARRIDAPDKVTGAAKYPSDVQPEGWLYGMILRSKWPAAKITAINLEKARQVPGIKAAILRDNRADRIVRYYGEEIAAVAGTSKQACIDALRLIEVQAEPLPFVVKEAEAMKETAPRVWPEGLNTTRPRVNERGDVEKGFADSTVIVEGSFSTPVQLHHPLETHGNTISVKDDEVTCWASTQGIGGVRNDLASYLGLQQSKVRVLTEFMGGGFGAKMGLGVEGGMAARLSQEAKAPVKLMLTRFDQSLAVGNRPSTFQKLRMGANADGDLLAFEMENFGTPGFASGGASAAGSGDVSIPAPYLYHVPNIRVRQTSVATNAGSARAFRAPGHPPASFGIESMLDDIAARIGMDPVELRIKNDRSNSREIRARQFRLGAERFGWKDKYKKPGSSNGPIKTGVGCAAATWGGGGRGTQAEAQVNPDGSVEVRCGTQDLGTGTKTLIAVIAADIFGLKPEQIDVRVGNSTFPPSGASGGSTTAASVSPAIFDTCTRALQQLQERSGVADARGEQWIGACRKLGMNPVTVQGRWQEGLSSSGAAGVQFAEVEVDTETGFTRVKKITCVQDGGLIVSKLTCESQVNGGIIMGIGYALYEERIMDELSGVVLNPNFETYKLPGIADMPEIDVVLLDMPERGVIGIGEPVTIPTASAIANAVANAIGVRVGSLPITPQKILNALNKDKAPVV